MFFLLKKHLILVQKIGYVFGGYPPPPPFTDFFLSKKGVTDLGNGSKTVPGTGQGLDPVNHEDDKGGGVGQLLLHAVEEPLHQFSTLPQSLQIVDTG